MKKTIIVTALSSLCFGLSSAHAGGSGQSDSLGDGAKSSSFYGGASVGRSYHDNCDELSGNQYGENFTCSRDSGDPAFKVFGGYKIMPNLAIEAGYIDFGEYSTIHQLENTTEDPAFEAKGLSLMVVGTIPVNERVNLFGKVGALRWEQDVTDPDHPERGTRHNEGTDLALGLGAEIKLSKNISLRAEAEHFDDLDANLFSVGVVFNTH
jgi:opacity protein-like surface antigen